MDSLFVEWLGLYRLRTSPDLLDHELSQATALVEPGRIGLFRILCMASRCATGSRRKRRYSNRHYFLPG